MTLKDIRNPSKPVGLRDLSRMADIDRKVLWHPYTQATEYVLQDSIIIERGEGPYLFDIRRRRFLDAFGSMWCNVWGHNHPELVKAIQAQSWPHQARWRYSGPVELIAEAKEKPAPTTAQLAVEIPQMADDVRDEFERTLREMGFDPAQFSASDKTE